jgi:hypothetical protein
MLTLKKIPGVCAMNQYKCNVLWISITLLSFCIICVASATLAAPSKEQIEQQRADIQKMADETLARLYKTQPGAEKAIKKAAGYAVFSNFGMKILFLPVAAQAKV